MEVNDAGIEELGRSLEPELRSKLLTQWSEAKFFAQVLQEDCASLPRGCQLVEIGSGSGLLAHLLSHQGRRVFAFEPTSSGFSQLQVLHELLKATFEDFGRNVVQISDALQMHDSRLGAPVHLAYSVNVIEHVPNLEEFVDVALSALKPEGRFRAICPNYLYPYEPHFDIPTVLNKEFTFWLMRRSILSHPREDAEAFWDDLNWVRPGSLVRIADYLGAQVHFSARATEHYLMRPRNDPDFNIRKKEWSRRLLRSGASVLGPVINKLSPRLLPIVDATFTRRVTRMAHRPLD